MSKITEFASPSVLGLKICHKVTENQPRMPNKFSPFQFAVSIHINAETQTEKYQFHPEKYPKIEKSEITENKMRNNASK